MVARRLARIPVAELLRDPFSAQSRSVRAKLMMASVAGGLVFNLGIKAKQITIFGIVFASDDPSIIYSLFLVLNTLFCAEFVTTTVPDLIQHALQLLHAYRASIHPDPKDLDALAQQRRDEASTELDLRWKARALWMLIAKLVLVDLGGPAIALGWFMYEYWRINPGRD